MAKPAKYRPQHLVAGVWEPVTRKGEAVVCWTKGSALAALQRVAAVSFQRASNACQPHEATVRVVDEYGAVVWPRVLRGYE